MKIKLTQDQIATLEVFVLDTIDSNKMKNIKNKFLNPDKSGRIHLSDEQYLFVLSCCEDKMSDNIFHIYELLIKQDCKDLIPVMQINSTIL